MTRNDLGHFLNLAAVGGVKGCSSGERAALALLRATWRYYLTLDGSARRGFVDALGWADESPEQVRDFLAAHGGVEF